MLNDDDEVKRKRYKKLAVTHSTKMKDGRVVRKRTAHRQPLAEDARKRSRFCGPLQAPRWQKDGVETRFMRRHCRQGLAVRDEESPAGYGGALPHRAWLTFLLDPAKYWVLFHWEPRFAGDVAVSDTKKVSLRAVVARVDSIDLCFSSSGLSEKAEVVFTSAYIDTTGGSAYGGHMEIFDVPDARRVRGLSGMALGDIGGSSVVGEVDMKYTQFHNLGKGALSVSDIAQGERLTQQWAMELGFIFHASENHNYESIKRDGLLLRATRQGWQRHRMAIHFVYAGGSASPGPGTVVRYGSNIFYAQFDIGTFLKHGHELFLKGFFTTVLHGHVLYGPAVKVTFASSFVMVNSLNGGIFLQEGFAVTIKDNAIAEDDSQVIARPLAETCPPRAIFNNEAVGTITGVFLHSQKSSVCQTINLYKIWKIAHVALYLSDVMPSKTVLSNIVIADAHNGRKPICESVSALLIAERRRSPNSGFVKAVNATFDAGEDIHMQKGLGRIPSWTYFEDTTFAYWKSDDCGMTSSDPGARFELSTEALDDAYRARASPCKSSGGGCMGLDQLLFQDADGTLTGVGAPFGTVLPLTPRTDIVSETQVCPNVTVDLLEMVNLDRSERCQAVVDFPPLKEKLHIQQFLRCANWLRGYLPAEYGHAALVIGQWQKPGAEFPDGGLGFVTTDGCKAFKSHLENDERAYQPGGGPWAPDAWMLNNP
ncbi:hypothetical protein AK812_SmicGene9143 [Symbiodinium microadriaticum]|uniref:Uncharacterized protein n=1 Tax=Symbiodinium microadriaticum TaxID=2951 RepID=A0A1Q9EJC9_SYMMI|nr:hypothetical protein AK812_SmicGene9143 [Symbiodinium microadriaticum]